MQAVKETHFQLPGQTAFYRGKVRDVYSLQDKLIMVASDRISAFDVILPRAIPYKGQVLNQIAAHFLQATSDIVPNWMLATPDPNVMIGKKCEPIRIEMVIRGYLSGHAWRTYNSGKRVLCGEIMPEGMNENDKFPKPIITPATKADEGHDEDISKDEIIERGILSKDLYEKLEHYTHKLYERGSQMAAERGLILVDTKYEFGLFNGEVCLIDEIHTPDSSRYFYADTYEENQRNHQAQKHLSKEFVRQWLIENGFQGLEGQHIPKMNDEVVIGISDRYQELFEQLTGQKLIKKETTDILNRIENNIFNFLTLKNKPL